MFYTVSMHVLKYKSSNVHYMQKVTAWLDVEKSEKHFVEDTLTHHNNQLTPALLTSGVKRRGSAPDGFRPATLKEMTNICCDYGCDIRDLLPYCSPFVD
uniref:Insulin-like domain-containing protein n=1 Tax=Romanomermis culicivorax TaxID=13658 RepID=A0A915KYJ3_ROMCU